MIKGYTEFSLKSPDCHPGAPVYKAYFKLDTDISQLFPYINAIADEAVYYESLHYIKFKLNDFMCALYPDEIHMGPFENRDQALDSFNKLSDFLNDIDSRKDTIEPNYEKYKHVSVLEVYKKLPRTNCKECGYVTCMACADAISKGETDFDICPEYELTIADAIL